MSSIFITYYLETMNKEFGFLGLGFASKVGQIMPASQG